MLDADFGQETAECLKIIKNLSPKGYCVSVNIERVDVDFVRVDYDLAWLKHYTDSGLLQDDPTVDFARSETGHVTWDKLREQYPERRTLFECRDFGIEEGNTIAVNVNGVRSLVSGAGFNWTKAQAREARMALYALQDIYAKRRE